MIHIKDWAIDADERCYIVGKLKTRTVKEKDGTERTEDFVSNPKYYTTLCAAFEGILEAERRSVIKDNELTLTEAMCRINDMQAEFRTMFRGFMEG